MEFNYEDIKAYGQPIYQCEPVEVFKAKIKNRPEKFVLKLISIKNPNEWNLLIQEAEICEKLDHPNIIKILKIFKIWTHEQAKLMFVMKYYEKGDLMKEITRRRMKREYWTEDELWQKFEELVRAFAYMQSEGLSHRDIKPQNILVNRSNKLKIGDFGNSKEKKHYKEAKYEELASIQGTDSYLSPKLREGLAEMYRDRNHSHTIHNVIKSDVYSLGITFLTMLKLETSPELNTLCDLENSIRRCVSILPYSDTIKNLLLHMLAVEEAKRPDFLTLEHLFDRSIALEPGLRIDSFSISQNFIEALCTKNIEACFQFLTPILEEDIVPPIRMEVKKERIYKYFEIFDSYNAEKEELEFLSALGKSIGNIEVDWEVVCIECFQPTKDIYFDCCNFAVHSKCIEIENEIVNCGGCEEMVSECGGCRSYFNPDKMFERGCEHRFCEACVESEKNCTKCGFL